MVPCRGGYCDVDPWMQIASFFGSCFRTLRRVGCIAWVADRQSRIVERAGCSCSWPGLRSWCRCGEASTSAPCPVRSLRPNSAAARPRPTFPPPNHREPLGSTSDATVLWWHGMPCPPMPSASCVRISPPPYFGSSYGMDRLACRLHGPFRPNPSSRRPRSPARLCGFGTSRSAVESLPPALNWCTRPGIPFLRDRSFLVEEG